MTPDFPPEPPGVPLTSVHVQWPDFVLEDRSPPQEDYTMWLHSNDICTDL